MSNAHTTKVMVNGLFIEKEKIGYETDKEAIEKARQMNLRPDTIRKVVAYKCSVCQKWHVGRTNKTLTEKDREHYRKVGGEYNFKPIKLSSTLDGTKIKRVIPSVELELLVKRNLGIK